VLLIVRNEDRQPRLALRCHTLFERGEERARDAGAAGSGRHLEEDDPALVVRRAGDRRPDDVLVVQGHDGVIFLARRENLSEGVDGLDALLPNLLPQAQDRVEIRGLVVTQARRAHGAGPQAWPGVGRASAETLPHGHSDGGRAGGGYRA